MAREIHILRRLNHPNVIKLEGLVTSRMSCSLYLVFEYMEHDLAGLASHPGLKFTEPQVVIIALQLPLSSIELMHLINGILPFFLSLHYVWAREVKRGVCVGGWRDFSESYPS